MGNKPVFALPCLFCCPGVLEHQHSSSASWLQMSHAAVSGLCRAIKLQCELYSSRQIAICLDPYCGLGFVLWCLCRYDCGGGEGKGELCAGSEGAVAAQGSACRLQTAYSDGSKGIHSQQGENLSLI